MIIITVCIATKETDVRVFSGTFQRRTRSFTSNQQRRDLSRTLRGHQFVNVLGNKVRTKAKGSSRETDYQCVRPLTVDEFKLKIVLIIQLCVLYCAEKTPLPVREEEEAVVEIS